MALYLGKVGRFALRQVVRRPWLDRTVDRFSNAAHRALGDRYTPRLTRDMFLLSEQLSSTQEIEIREDGFYRAKERLAPNPLGKYFERPVTFMIMPSTPEALVTFARSVRKIMRCWDKSNDFMPSNYGGHLLDPLLKSAQSVEALRLAGEIAVEYSYRHRLNWATSHHPPSSLWNILFYGLPGLLQQVTPLERLERAGEMITRHMRRIGDPIGYMRTFLPAVLNKTMDLEAADRWDKQLITLQLALIRRYGATGQVFCSDVLPILVERAESDEELAAWILAACTHLNYYAADVDTDTEIILSPWSTILENLATTLRNSRSLEEFNEKSRILQAFAQRMEIDQVGFRVFVLPRLFSKPLSPREVERWEAPLGTLIRTYDQRIAPTSDRTTVKFVRYNVPSLVVAAVEPADLAEAQTFLLDPEGRIECGLQIYGRYVLPAIFRKAEASPPDRKTSLAAWDRAAKQLIQVAKSRDADLELFAIVNLTRQIQNAQTPEDLLAEGPNLELPGQG